MKCAWQAYLNLLPIWMREEVDKLGKETLLETRLRLGYPPELVRVNGSVFLKKVMTDQDLSFCINVASRYSPWAANTMASGYITAEGGHRIGVCGEAIIHNNRMTGIRRPGMICLRVARDFPGIAKKISSLTGSVLFIGRPGSGKTTLLRDFIRLRSESGQGSVCVVDERDEIFPRVNHQYCFDPGLKTDVISGCSKRDGINAALRNMSPQTIALDEITADEDCQALVYAGWCGVDLIATAHAGSRRELFARPVYKPLIDSSLFQYLIILQYDKSWFVERMYK